MPYTASEALAWVGKYINKAKTDKIRHYAVLDLVSFMGVISRLSDDEWYKSYALLLYYNTLGRDKQNPIGAKYSAALKFSYDNGSATGDDRDKDTKPTINANATALSNKNIELHGCGQCAYFADQAGEMLAIPQLKGKPTPPLVEKVALSNHNLIRVNGDAAAPANHVIVDLWWIALGHPVAKSICKLSDWGLKRQYDSEGGVTLKKTYDPVGNRWT